MERFTDIELDALKEFTSVGTSHAATALSKLLDRKVEVSVPDAKLVEVTKIPDFLGGGEQFIDGLYFRIHGDINGSILMFLQEAEADVLVNILMAGIPDNDLPDYQELRKSALMELGNILTNSYLNALAEMLEMRILLSVPHFASDSLAAVMDFLLIELIQVADYALLINTVIKLPDTEVKGSFIMFPDPESMEKIFKRTGIR